MSNVLATIRQRVLYEARKLWSNGFRTYDCETTGLEWEDQVIQWAVCDQEGRVLGSGYVKPTVPISEGAFKVHGIREEQLVDAPAFAEVWPTIFTLLKDQIVVMYNAIFDVGKIRSSALAHGIDVPYDAIQSVCAMDLFARFYGEYHEYWETYTWQKLNEVAVPHLGIVVPGEAHNTEHDVVATAMIVKKMAELADQELAPDWHPPVNVPCAGCGYVIQECAEADEVWYCRQCSLERGLFHHCPGCNSVVKSPSIGFSCDDLCEYCHKQLYQEKMLLTAAWHRCPKAPRSRALYSNCFQIVESSDLEELCEHCKLQREWKRKYAEAERERQARILQERKEHRRAYAKVYRQEKKERALENQRRARLGLPPLEKPKPQPPEEFFTHEGHRFQRRKDEDGRPEVICLTCEGVWRTPPSRWCAGVKVYSSWQSIPGHLKTKTQLLKLKLTPARGQKHDAVMETAFNRYNLYNENNCVPIERKLKAKK